MMASWRAAGDGVRSTAVLPLTVGEILHHAGDEPARQMFERVMEQFK